MELYERVLHRLLVAIACFVVFVSTLARPLAPPCAMHSASKMLYQAMSDTTVRHPHPSSTPRLMQSLSK